MDVYACLAIIFLLLLVLWKEDMFSQRLPCPPGPKGLPLIGNIRDIPPDCQWLTYASWSHEFKSDVIYLNLAGTNLLVVNSLGAAVELFEKRSAIYSDKILSPMITELCGFDWAFGQFLYNKKWKAHRRLFHQHFNANVGENFEPHQLKATHEFLNRLVESPKNFMNQLHLMAASFILNVAYGIDAQSLDDPYIVVVEKPVKILTIAANPGAFLVNSIPILKYVPEWFPGAGFKKKAREWRKPIQDAPNILFQYVKDAMAKRVYTPSFVSRCLKELGENNDAEAEEAIRGVAATMHVAGSNTTVSALDSFFLAMVLNSDVFKKGQEEVDRVVGRHRLPSFSDRSSLPYVSALVKECLRWEPVAPFPLAHTLRADDIYEGRHMPAGSIVLANSWAMLHDEAVYPDHQRFHPERFLKDGQLDPDIRPPEIAAFGFGPRICPAKHLAMSSMFITIASVLSAFDIGKAVDESGNEITPSGEYTSGLSRYPLPFPCFIKPRSSKALSLITDARASHL